MRYTQVLRGEEDLRELLDDDDDEDEDFTLDWDELMGPNPFGQGDSGHLCFASALSFMLLHIKAHPSIQQGFGNSVHMCS